MQLFFLLFYPSLSSLFYAIEISTLSCHSNPQPKGLCLSFRDLSVQKIQNNSNHEKLLVFFFSEWKEQFDIVFGWRPPQKKNMLIALLNHIKKKVKLLVVAFTVLPAVAIRIRRFLEVAN